MRFSVLPRSFLGVVVALSILEPLSAAVLQGQGQEQEQSQEQAPAGTGTSQEEAPRPIELSEIPRRSEETNVRLDAIEASLAPSSDVETIGREIPSWSQRLDAAKSETASRPPSERSLRELTESRNAWVGRQAQIDEWLGVLERRTSELQAALDEVRTLGTVWSLTREAAAGDIPAGVRDAIRRVMNRVGEVERAAQNRLGVLLTMQNTLAEQATSVREELEKLRAVLGDVRESLLSRDSPPLWTALASEADRGSLLRQALDSFARTWESVRQYASENLERLSLQALTFFALVWLFVELRKRGGRWKGREELEASVRMLSHPVANALLITLLMTRLFHPTAPLGFYDLNRFLLLVPLLTILPGLVYPSMRAPLYGLAALYAGDLLVDLLPSQALLTRLMQLVLSGVALTGLVQLARPGGTAARLELGGWWRAAVAASRVSILLLAVSLLANLLGRLSLSVMLTDAVLTSAFVAVALFAGILVTEGLWTLLLETRRLQSLEAVRKNVVVLRTFGSKLLRIVAVTGWVAITLRTVQLLDPVMGAARELLSATLAVGTVEISLGNVLAFVITIYLTFVISRIAQHVLDDDVLPRFALPRGVPGAVSMLAHYAIVLLGILFALAAAGIQMSRFALLAGAFGVGIGFGLQNIVNNFISGLILLFERPIQVGDTIELETLFGKVLRIGIRSSTVRTFEGAEVIVPNAHIIDSKVVNWTLSDRLRRIEVNVGVAYGSRPRDVIETLLEVAKKHRDVLDEPEPYALFEGFGDSSLDFVLRAWITKFDEYLRIRSELRLGVHDALEAAGFEIPFPQRDLHVKSMPDGKDIERVEAEETPPDRAEPTHTR